MRDATFYQADEKRYDAMPYRRCGRSGIKLPAVSLGLWHNFGYVDDMENSRNILLSAFDQGITHFDLANNYGPPYGSAETVFGRIMTSNLVPYRDEMIISTKAGYDMWPGPYGDFGSRKYLVASCNQSLKRMNLEYVDIFYHHRPDPGTPLEETMMALDYIVRSGKALYAGISNYPRDLAQKAIQILDDLGTPCLIHQPRYNMFDRWIEDGLLDLLGKSGVGCIVFSPLAQGILTDKYLHGIPEGSRASKEHGYLKKDAITGEKMEKIRALNEVAMKRSQSLAQMALSWCLRDNRVTSVLIGASSTNQLKDSIGAMENLSFSKEELEKIERVLSQ